jgi:beta-aspartyl-peptidase (threonine type)
MEVYVHGGVSGLEKPVLPSLAHALERSVEAVTAVDAVERAVIALEDDPSLNAGFGSVLTVDGTVEMDAGIADGATGASGAVANVSVANPIRLARRVMEKTPHLLIAGAGAMALASGLPLLEDTTPAQRARWQAAREQGTLGPTRFGAPEHVDTVGAVALDDDGRLAAASSTGGVLGKLPGRVGDAPVFGAGLYASPQVAVVGTGVGELFLETLAALRVALLIEDGAHPQEACERVVQWTGTRRKVSAGLLALDAHARVGAAFRGGSLAVEGRTGVLEAVRLNTGV